jgi:hypothetical protein
MIFCEGKPRQEGDDGTKRELLHFLTAFKVKTLKIYLKTLCHNHLKSKNSPTERKLSKFFFII